MQIATTPVILDDIHQTTKKFLELAGKVSDLEDGSKLSSSHKASTTPVITTSTWTLPIPSPTPFQFNSLFTTAIPNLDIPTPGSTYLSQQPSFESLVPTMGSGYLSPRLDYGLVNHLWTTSPSTPWDNPWLSYLIGRPSSFASRLYIDSLGLIVRAIRGEVRIPSFIPSVLRYRFRHEDSDSLMRLIAGQLQRLRLDGHTGAERPDTDPKILLPGALTPNSPDAVFTAGQIIQSPVGMQSVSKSGGDGSFLEFNPPDFVKLNSALENLLVEIGRDVMLEGGTPGDWLDPWSVQQYLNEDWGLWLNAGTIRHTPKTLSVLRSFHFLRQGKTVGRGSTQPTNGIRQNLQWPSGNSGDDFRPTVPLMLPTYTMPSSPFKPDPFIAQRLAFVAGVAPSASSSYIPTTIPAFHSVPVSGGPDLTFKDLNPNYLQSSGSSTSLPQAYQRNPSSYQTFTDASGSDHLPFEPKVSGTRTRTSRSTRSPASTAPESLVSLPEILPAAPLVRTLILRSVCFGEGPRYQKPTVNETVRDFLEAHATIRG